MPRRILIIDDDKGVVETVKSALVKRNYEVFTANDGQKGLEQANVNQPDLILLDVVMPSLNGYEFLRALKAQKTIEGEAMTPVIIITAKEEMEDLFRFEGVREYVVKPVDPVVLVGKIEENLGSDG